MTPPPYAALLRQAPQQARSQARVERILDAAAALMATRDPSDFTVRDVTDAAGVPTGTLYQFFPDLNSVLQALALRYVAETPSVLEVATSAPGGWEDVVDRTVDAYAEMVRSAPAIRRLWLSGVLDAATRTAERQTDAQIAAELGAELQRRAGVQCGEAHQWQLLVALVDAVLHQAFGVDPAGDDRVLAEGRIAARAYAATVLGLG